MYSIPHNKRYLPHDLNTKFHAVTSFRNGNDINFVCRKYHCSRSSLWRWNKKFDGSKNSLIDKSHKPLSIHPHAHSDLELKWIKDLIKRNPHASLLEIWYKLKLYKGYSRHPGSLYRILRSLGFYDDKRKLHTSKRTNQPYDTPQQIGIKWQVDVKYVPKECKAITLPNDRKYYQYTCIDEASRERFIFHYEEHTPANTVDFIKRCFLYYKYKPKIIQTDNGSEFTYNKSNIKRIHPLDQLCINEDIYHQKIKPRTPRHNGKVERSHRNDKERFYSYLTFYSLEDLRKQAKVYLRRSNNIPMQVLNYLTPIEKRKQLIKEMKSF